MPRPLTETQLIRDLRRIFVQSGASIEVGIGDDAAVLQAGQGRLVWTVDASFEGVHFKPQWLRPVDIGYRAVQAAVSDVAAMGARPTAMLSSLGVPQRFGRQQLLEIARGQAKAAKEHRCPIVGGNLSRSDRLSVTTTVLARVKMPLLRSAARAGDELWLVGDVGLARAGLLSLSRDVADLKGLASAVRAWRRPKAKVAQGQVIAARAHAGIDVSDGLTRDAIHISEASGVKIVIVQERLQAALPAALLVAARALGESALQLALTGGEDYALLACGPARRRPAFAKSIGQVEAGAGAVLRSSRGDKPLSGGFDHFRQ